MKWVVETPKISIHANAGKVCAPKTPALNDLDLDAGQQAVREVYADEKVSRYIVQLIQATRAHPDLSLGGSPRASMAARANMPPWRTPADLSDRNH